MVSDFGINLLSSKIYFTFDAYNVFGFFTDCIIVSEGANTMDIGRSMLLNELPRHRLDAG